MPKKDIPEPPHVKNLDDIMLLAGIRGGFDKLVGAKIKFTVRKSQ